MSPRDRLRRLWRRVRPRLAALYLAGVAGLAVTIAADPLRRVAVGAVEAAVAAHDAAWPERLARGEALVVAGRFEEAAAYLERLDSVFPARYVKHRLDRERERLLEALGLSYAALGRKRRTLDAFTRLVAFDPRNYRNHYLLAAAAVEFYEPELAREHLEHVLAIDPQHLPALEARIALDFAGGEFAGVVALYERYLDAVEAVPVEVRLGAAVGRVYVPFDGRPHDVETPLPHPGGRAAVLALRTAWEGDGAGAGPPLELAAATAIAPVVVGRPGRPRTTLGPEPAPLADADGVIELEVPPLPHPVGRVRLRLRLPKPAGPTLWRMVEKSYRNTLDFAGLEAARARSSFEVEEGAGPGRVGSDRADLDRVGPDRVGPDRAAADRAGPAENRPGAPERP